MGSKKIRRIMPLLLLLAFLLTACRGAGQKDGLPETAAEFDRSDITIGLVKGFVFDDAVSTHLPKAQIRYFDDRESAFKALTAGEVDAVADDEASLRARMRSTELFRLAEGYLEPSDYGFVFPKDERGEKYRQEFNEYLAGERDSGRLAQLDEKWFGDATDNKTSRSAEELSGENGTVTMAFHDGNIPFEYMSAGRPVGYEIDLAIGFCEKYGYGLELRRMPFTELMSEVAEGAYDAGCGSVTETEKRKEDLLFSDPVYSGGISLLVLSGPVKEQGKGGPFAGAVRKIRGALLDEGRFFLFLKGILTTFAIAAAAVVIGTPFGFILYINRLRGGFIARGITGALVSVLHGVPPILLIMAVYYLYYRDLYFGAVLASVIGFSLCFSEEVCSIIRKHASLQEDGELERDYRLVYIDSGPFFEELFRGSGEFIKADYIEKVTALIKATSVTGLIMVRDITKTADVIRMESLETMVPILAAAAAYFLLTAGSCRLLRKILRVR